jgi:5-methylcytosine-specific restriction enzyme subunit McrC
MILNDLTLSTDGESSSGESLLINFDRVFEDFIKKVLMEYSSLGKFSYWTSSKSFAFCHQGDEYFERSYLPDLLYDYVDKNGRQTARAILDMKNKTSLPFHNDDIYQMAFYGQMLSCKKIILCYPGNENRSNTALRFNNEKFFLHKIYGSYMNLAGNSAKEFKDNIASFVYRVECLL